VFMTMQDAAREAEHHLIKDESADQSRQSGGA